MVSVGIMLRALIILFCLAHVALAVNSIDQDFACPFDGFKWKQRMETSADAKGLRLDLRQLGDVVQPPTLPQCPKCRAVLFMDVFPPKVLASLKPFIATEDFAQFAGKYPTYYVLAQMQERLKAPPYYTGYSYLRASWQLEAKPAAARHCMARAHECFAAALADKTNKHSANTALLLGELERRLERFENAEARFRVMIDGDAFKEAGHQRIIARQMELIAKRDSQPHGIFPAHDALVSAPAVSVLHSSPAPVGAKPLPRVEVIVPHSLESVSEAAEKIPRGIPKPKVITRP